MKKMMMVFVVLFAMVGSSFGGYADTGGRITELSSTCDGILIKVSGVNPTNCTPASGTFSGWYLIRNKYKGMMATVLMAWRDNLSISLCTNYNQGLTNSWDGFQYGNVSQISPVKE